jgi:hypothetical protein
MGMKLLRIIASRDLSRRPVIQGKAAGLDPESRRRKLDSHVRGHDASAVLSVKNPPLKDTAGELPDIISALRATEQRPINGA